jgi:hypothetical protein
MRSVEDGEESRGVKLYLLYTLFTADYSWFICSMIRSRTQALLGQQSLEWYGRWGIEVRGPGETQAWS